MRSVLEAAEAGGVPVRVTDRARLDVLARDHQGVIATTTDRGGPGALGEHELADFPFDDDAIVVVLDGIVDPQNLGAAARTAEAAGATMLVNRARRAADATPAAVRASAGALLHLPYARVANIARSIERLQEAGFWVVGLDGDAPVEMGDEPCPVGRIALVIGSEETGLSHLVRERCDATIAVPMRGRVASLNAAASLAAVLYAWVVPSRDATVRPPSGR
jgi:23S rRNA (guanosine2251-2'-O)-methyltransferase